MSSYLIIVGRSRYIGFTSIAFADPQESMSFINRILDIFPNASQFCFCCSVEKGTLFIGWLNAIVYLLSVTSDIRYLVASSGQSGTFIGIMVVFLIADVAFVLASAFLILGVKNGNPRYVFLWLSVALVMILFYVLLFIMVLISSLLLLIFWTVLGTIWRLYCIAIVNSYYRNMDGGPVTY